MKCRGGSPALPPASPQQPREGARNPGGSLPTLSPPPLALLGAFWSREEGFSFFFPTPDDPLRLSRLQSTEAGEVEGAHLPAEVQADGPLAQGREGPALDSPAFPPAFPLSRPVRS